MPNKQRMPNKQKKQRKFEQKLQRQSDENKALNQKQKELSRVAKQIKTKQEIKAADRNSDNLISLSDFLSIYQFNFRMLGNDTSKNQVSSSNQSSNHSSWLRILIFFYLINFTFANTKKIAYDNTEGEGLILSDSFTVDVDEPSEIYINLEEGSIEFGLGTDIFQNIKDNERESADERLKRKTVIFLGAESEYQTTERPGVVILDKVTFEYPEIGYWDYPVAEQIKTKQTTIVYEYYDFKQSLSNNEEYVKHFIKDAIFAIPLADEYVAFMGKQHIIEVVLLSGNYGVNVFIEYEETIEQVYVYNIIEDQIKTGDKLFGEGSAQELMVHMLTQVPQQKASDLVSKAGNFFAIDQNPEMVANVYGMMMKAYGKEISDPVALINHFVVDLAKALNVDLDNYNKLSISKEQKAKEKKIEYKFYQTLKDNFKTHENDYKNFNAVIDSVLDNSFDEKLKNFILSWVSLLPIDWPKDTVALMSGSTLFFMSVGALSLSSFAGIFFAIPAAISYKKHKKINKIIQRLEKRRIPLKRQALSNLKKFSFNPYDFKLILDTDSITNKSTGKIYTKNTVMKKIMKEFNRCNYQVTLDKDSNIIPITQRKNFPINSAELEEFTNQMNSYDFMNKEKSMCFKEDEIYTLIRLFKQLDITIEYISDDYLLRLEQEDNIYFNLTKSIEILDNIQLEKIKLSKDEFNQIFKQTTENLFGNNAFGNDKKGTLTIDLSKVRQAKVEALFHNDATKEDEYDDLAQRFKKIKENIIEKATQQNNFIKKKGDIKLASENFSEKAIKEKIVSIKKELKQKKEKTIEQNKSIEKEIIYYQGVKDHIAVDLNEKYTAYKIVNNVLNPLDKKKSNIEKKLEKFEFNRETETQFRNKIQEAHKNFKNEIKKAVEDHDEQLLTKTINSATNSIEKIKQSYQIEVQENLELVSGDLLKKIGNNPLIKQAISTYNQKLTQAADDSENGSSESDEELETDEEIESQTSYEGAHSNSTSDESQNSPNSMKQNLSSTKETLALSSANAKDPDKTKTQNSNNNNNPVVFKECKQYLAFVGKNKVGLEYDETEELDILTILDIDRNKLLNLLLGKFDSNFQNCFVEVMKAWLIEHKDGLDQFNYLGSTDIEEAIKNEDDEELELLIKDDLKVSIALLHAGEDFPIHPKIALWVAAQKRNSIAIAIWQESTPGAFILEAIGQVLDFNEQLHYFCNQDNQYFKLTETEAPRLIQRSSPILPPPQPKINNQQLNQLRDSIRNYFNELKALQQKNDSVEDKLLYSFLFARASGEFLSAYNKQNFDDFEKQTPEFLTLANKLIHTAPFVEPKNIETQLNVFIKNIITAFKNKKFPTFETFQQNLHGIQVLDSVLSEELTEPWQAYQKQQINMAYQNRINEKMESRKSAWDVMILGECYQGLAKQAGLTDNDLSNQEKKQIQHVVFQYLNFDENTQNLLWDAYLARNQVAHNFKLNAEQKLAPLKTEEQQQLSLVNK